MPHFESSKYQTSKTLVVKNHGDGSVAVFGTHEAANYSSVEVAANGDVFYFGDDVLSMSFISGVNTINLIRNKG